MEQHFSEAIKIWKLEELYQDLAVIKGHALTDWEKTCLRGLLCRYSPKYIAQQTYWTVNALRTELSRRLYRYIEELTDRKMISTKVSWNTIANSLDELGYKQLHPERNLVSNVGSNLVTPPTKDLCSLVKVSEVIATISQLGAETSQYSRKNTVKDPNIISIYSKLIKEGDRSSQQQNYVHALECYYRALVSFNSVNVSILMSIAACYNQLHLHGDSLALCYFTLGFLPTAPTACSDRYQIHTFIGGIFRALAREKGDLAYFNIALNHYDLATNHYDLAINNHHPTIS
jgi:tetratricopeptide (TPR) repeat protein